MRLFGVELSRFFSRSLVRWLFVVTVLVSLGAGGLALGSAQPPSAEQRASVETEFAAHHADWEANHEEQHEQCLTEQEAAQAEHPDIDFGCEYLLEEPRLSDWLWEPSFATEGLMQVLGMATAILLIAVLAAVGFVSAEFSTGSIGTWLTFEPRRVRVYLSKLFASVLGVALLVALGFSLTLGGVIAAFAFHGTLGNPDPELWTELARTGGRTVLAGVVLAVGGTALAMLVRHLAAALGIAMGWSIVEQIVAGVLPRLTPWTLTLNLQALVQGSASYYVDSCSVEAGERTCEYLEHVVSSMDAGLYLGAIAAVVSLVALVVFVRRDVG